MTVTVTNLDNGLRVATDTMDSVETVSVGAWIDAGTRNEAAEANGVAHLLEHMVFKGTERRSARDIAAEIESVGGQINAYTGRESTAFFAKVLKEDTALAVDTLADILQNSVFDAGELERERAVVVQEIGQAVDTPDDAIFDHFQTAAFPGQALGRPVLGTADLVANMPRNEMIGFMQAHYGAPRMILAAAGRVDHDRLVDLAADCFGALPGTNGAAAEPASYAGGEILESRDLEQLHVLLGLRGLPHEDADFYALAVLNTLLGGGMSSRLFQEVRENRGLAYSVYSFCASYRDDGLFGIYAGTAPEQAGELVSVILDQVAALQDGPDDAELASARAQLKASTLMALESTWARCESLANHLQVFDRAIPVAEIVASIEAVDAADVARVVRRLLSAPPTFAALGPLDDVPDYATVAERLR